jgi:hypothetical protein
MRKFVNRLFKEYYKHRIKRVQKYLESPHEVQHTVWKQLMNTAKNTEWGKQYDFKSLKTQQQFSERIPIQDYESLKPFIERMMHGERDVLWHGEVRWFSKSSGTTSDKSKFIPVSTENLKQCHIRGTWDTMTFFYNQRPDARQFECKSLLMGGSLNSFAPHPRTTFGDVSAVMIQHMPWVARPFFTPDFETALMPDFGKKIEKMARVISKEKDLVMIGGVPTWTVVLFRRVLELTGADNLLELWPNLQGYIHGGVSFMPYKKQFQSFLPSDKVSYQEIYNASEGYFAAQNEFSEDGMVLLLENGIYYEFIPMGEWEKEFPKAIPLSEVEVGKTYAIVITTNSGLWRYTPGDTVTFLSTAPYKIKVSGRTKQYVNAFGEEVMVENTDKAIAMTCNEVDALVSDYTVAPIYFKGAGKGGHEWLIEFSKPPRDIIRFNELLDENLQKVNSDYEAKRYKEMALTQLKLHPVPTGTFNDWLKSKGRYTSQSKVPRLSNDRRYIEDILGFLEEQV